MRQYTVDQLVSRLQALKLVQGPLAGVSSVPFRDLIWQYSQPAWVYSEMTSCKTILSGSDVIKRRYLQTSHTEGPLCLQMATSDPDECARACAVLNQLDISLVDLNVGCPVKKIRKRAQGSYLLSHPERLRSVLRAMRQSCHHPISVKIRVDGNSCDQYNAHVLDVINDVKPDFLVVHGRHYQDGYDVPCFVDQIAFFAQHACCPVIGNGDVSDISHVREMLLKGCAGVMVARASVGAPWLIGQLQEKMGLIDHAQWVDCAESWQVFLHHIQSLSTFLGGEAFALRQACGLVKYYAKRNGFSHEQQAQVRSAKCFDDLVNLHV